MRLIVSTPLAVVIDTQDVAHVRAEDATGAFGILPGHADFLTALHVSVVSWRAAQGDEQHAAVDGGMLQVRDGATIAIATREAVPGTDLFLLEADVLTRFRHQHAREQMERRDAERLYLAAIRRILSLVHPDSAPAGLAASGVWTEELEQ